MGRTHRWSRKRTDFKFKVDNINDMTISIKVSLLPQFRCLLQTRRNDAAICLEHSEARML